MQSGIVFGYAGLVDGLCRRIQEELGHPCRVVATGGYAPLIASQASSIERVDPNLTLDGLRLVYERNPRAAKRA
jgi:type III pantothenate kinase